MALSSILSIGLHLTIFLVFYYGFPFSKIKDRNETTIPLIFEEDLEVSNKTNLKKNEKLVKTKKKTQINNKIKNSPKPKPKKLISKIIPQVKAISENNKNIRIFVKGDKNANYGSVLNVLARIKSAGYSKATLVAKLKN